MGVALTGLPQIAYRQHEREKGMIRAEAHHPYHEHQLTKVDTRRTYAFCDARWKCDCCQRHLDGTIAEETYAYHCHKCEFDLCQQCYQGSLHPFHQHRLRPANPLLCYGQTEGQWRCDACLRVFSPLTSKMSWHCSKCQIDLCTECKEGAWTHILHNAGDVAGGGAHTMTPVDPRILYRCYSQWQCDHCGTINTHGGQLWTLFHCNQCDNHDMCLQCFSGHKHHLHQHGLVIINSDDRGTPSHTHISCQLCCRQLRGSYYTCRKVDCQFTICHHCFNSSPPTHPLHPHHPLYLTDPAQVYPQSGGVWHCDSCTNHHPQHKQSALRADVPMYHCKECQYDLCEDCYHQRPRPLLTSEGATATGSSRHQNFLTDDEALKRQPVHRPAYIPSAPSPNLHVSSGPSICHLCGLASARLTLKHGARKHSQAVYCHRCAFEALKQRLACPLCGKLPDGLAEVPQ